MPSSPAVSRFRLVPILLSQAFGILCGIIGVKLNSHFVLPEVLGVYGIFLTFAPIGMWVVHAGLVKFVARHWAASPNRAALVREMMGAWARRLPWLALGAAIATATMMRFGNRDWFTLWLSLFGAATLLAFVALVQTAIQAERSHWRDFAVSATSSISRTFAPLLLFLTSGGIAAALWLGFLGHAIIAAFVSVLVMRRYWHNPASPLASRGELTAIYDGPLFIILATITWVVTSLNRWIVAWHFGEAETGYFTLVGGAAAIVATTFGTALLQYFQPGFFALGDDRDGRRSLARRVDLAVLGYFIAAAFSLGAFAIIAPQLVGPLINPRYASGLRWLLPAGCFSVATMIPLFYHSMLLAGRRERACGPVDITTAGFLAIASLLAVRAGQTWFIRWLLISPVVPFVLTRPLARWYLFAPEPNPRPEPAREKTSV